MTCSYQAFIVFMMYVCSWAVESFNANDLFVYCYCFYQFASCKMTMCV